MNHLAMGHSLHGVFPVVAVLGGVAALAFILWLVFRNRVIGASGLCEHERQTLPGEEADLLAMLRQKGGPMTQPDICENTGRTPEDIAALLQSLEDRGLVKRDWQPEGKAYTVIAV
jgi:DNA-binding MarR family transcriptional regulator